MRGNGLEPPQFAVTDDLGNHQNIAFKPRKKKKKKGAAARKVEEFEQQPDHVQEYVVEETDNQPSFHPEGGNHSEKQEIEMSQREHPSIDSNGIMMQRDGAQNPNDYENEGQYGQELIMSKADYDKVQAEYDLIKIEQRKLGYRTKKMISENFFCKWACCCRVKDRLELSWDEMTPIQKKHRIKTLWKKAKRVFLFQRLKMGEDSSQKNKSGNQEEEGDDILENISRSSEHEWKWWIIRQQNPLPQLWNFITNFLTIYALFVTPWVIVFSEDGVTLKNFEIFVDSCFTLDIMMSFIRLNENQKQSDFPQIRIDYLKNAFVFDCVAALPGLLTLEDSTIFIIRYTKICRFIHYDRVFDQLNLLTENILMGWLGYTRQKVSEYIEFVKLEISIVLLTHLMACMWILIGASEGNGWVESFISGQKAATGDRTLTSYDFAIEIYANAFYFILTTITTVGYGDISGTTTLELLFSMCVEFVGLTFFSFLTGTISVMFSGDQSFESLINARMEQLDLWLLRLENCNKEEKIPNRLYHSIKEFIQDAFVYDYNLIIEEFNFYNELPAQIQNQISESLFKSFKNQFSNFFLNTDIGFQHQLIVNMYCRIYEPGKTIISHGQKLNEMYFITRGTAIFYDQKGVTPFLQLPCFSFFGEYQLMFDLRSNFVVKVGGKEDYSLSTAKQDRTFFLCVSQEVFQKLFEQFPKSKFVAQKRALERRKVFIEHLEKLETFLDEKDKKMKKLTKKRLRNEASLRELKGIMTGGIVKKTASKAPVTDNQESSSSQTSSDGSQESDDEESEASDDEIIERASEFHENQGTYEDDMKLSTEDNHYQVSEIVKDPEQEAKEEYMRKLMSFRKDELILPEESEEDENENETAPLKEKDIQGVEDSYELVDSIEDKMNKIANVIRGMDKRMSYNLRLLGSVVAQDEEDQQKLDDQKQDQQQILEDKQNDRKDKIIPKIKKMAQFTINRFEMSNIEDQLVVDGVKRNLLSTQRKTDGRK